MALPAQNDITNAATVADLQPEFEDQRDFISTLLGGGPRTELTVGSGTVTPGARDHGGIFTLDTQSDAATDDLDTITNTNVSDGQLIMLMAESESKVVTLKHGDGGTGEMLMTDSADFVLDKLDKWIMFRREGAAFVEVQRCYGNNIEETQANLGISRMLSGSKLCPHEGLDINRTSASAVSVTASALVLQNAAGFQKLYAAVSETLDLTLSGAGGLDTGSESSDTWYHMWAVGQADGTINCVFSVNDSTPTLPSGHTFYGYLGAIRNSSSSALYNFRQLNSVAHMWADSGDTSMRIINAGTSSTFVAVSYSSVAPATAKSIALQAAAANSTISGAQLELGASLSPGAVSSDYAAWGIVRHNTAGNSTWVDRTVPQITPGTLYYRIQGSSATATVWVTGWSF